MIEHRTIWRCDRAGCEAMADTPDQGSDPPKGWDHFFVDRCQAQGFRSKGSSAWITICPAHVADAAAVLPGAFGSDPDATARFHEFPGGGLQCRVCGYPPDEAPQVCEGP